MGLSKFKVGELITPIDERNKFGIKEFYGININKEFMPTAADTNGLDETKYKVVRKNRFVYSGMQTGRDECIRVSMYNGEKPILVSPAYTTFEVSATDKVLPTYFFMKFLSKEMDRYGAFRSDGSIRSNLEWEVFCDIEITLPSVEIQQKFVEIYRAMILNSQSYERGLEDLKLCCDAYIENLRKQTPCETIEKYIRQKNDRNKDGAINFVMGLSTKKEFREPTSRVNKDELSDYKIVNLYDFAFVPATDTWKVLAFAYNDFGKPLVVSPIYVVFEVDKEKLLPEYLAMWLSRLEFDRYARFHSWGSARENFNFEDMAQVKIPIPKREIQESIVNIYKAYTARKAIAENLRAKIQQICPILIRGAMREGER